MSFSKARYVTVCQQFLVTFVVVAVGVSSAGIMTLRIVTPEGTAVGTPGRSPSVTGIENRDLAPAVRTRGEGYVDTRPVRPTVAEVKVAGVDRHAERTLPKTSVSPDSEHPTTATSRRAVAALRTAVLTAPEKVHGYATVGVTWAHGINLPEDAISVQVRTENHGVWSAWTVAPYHDDHGPDGGEADSSRERPGTDAVVIGAVERVQMRALTRSGTAPTDVRLAVIDPGAGAVREESPAIDTARIPASDTAGTGAPVESTGDPGGPADPQSTAGDSVALSAMKVSPKPTIYSRAQWGADEGMREKSSLHYGTIEAGFVHHTVNANNYTRAEVPALIRGIYAFHTRSRGWSDIGYNFLVDRFGRIWEGRYGGVDRAVVGAHTLGYNEVSFAMSTIGNFEIAKPPEAVIDAYARLFAWKLSLYDIRANNPRVYLKNRWVQAINGHRDVGQTACPGKYLYARIPDIRVKARAIQIAADSGTTPKPPTPPPAPTPIPQQSPDSATSQPSGITFRARTNLAGNGWPDLVLKSPGGALTVLPTGGQVGYRPPVTTSGAWGSMSHVAAVGDLTGDGKADVLGIYRSTHVARVYAGDGTGHVSLRGIGATTRFSNADLLVGAGDLTGDHKSDVVARDARTKRLFVYPGRGNGQFAPRRLLATHWGGYVATAVPGDLDGDGLRDVVAQTTTGNLYLFPGRSGGHLGAPRLLKKLGTTFTTVLGSGDLSGNDVPDLVVRSASTGASYLYPATGHGALGHYFGPFPDLAGYTQLSTAAMVGSAAADVVGVDSRGRLAVLAHNGAMNLLAPVRTGLSVPDASQVLDVGDWNGDGKGDMITRQVGGDRLVLRLGAGNGTFPRSVPLGAGWKSITRLAAVGDVTGDRHPDLMGQRPNGSMVIFPGNGGTGFKRPVLAAALLRTYNQIGGERWYARRAPTSTFPGTDGSFVPFGGPDATTATRSAGLDMKRYDWVIGVGDVDGDKVADVLVRERSTGDLWLLPGDGDGFGPRRFVGPGFAGYTLAN